MAEWWEAAPLASSSGGNWWDAAPLVEQPAPESGFSTGLANAGRFGASAVIGAARGVADFALDPMSPVRRMIDPRLEDMEQSVRPQPGRALEETIYAAAPEIEYKPGGALDRTALAAAQGAIAGGPFGLAGALYGGLGGALGQGTHELTGSERAAIAAGFAPGLIAPAARGTVNAAAGKLRETFGPALSPRYREGLAGEQLLSAATDPDSLKSALNIDQVGPIDQSLVPGSLPTTFQLSGDMGLGQLERGMRSRNAAPFLDRAAEQNTARTNQIGALAPETAAPSAVRDLLRQRLDALDTETDANVRAAEQNARQALDIVGGNLTPDIYGALMRDQLEAAKTTTKRNESRLWEAIDPEGKLVISGRGTQDAANQIASEIPRTARPPEGEEAAIFEIAKTLGDARPFNEFSALRGRLLDAIREERKNGQTPSLRRMQMLRSAMDDTIAGAAEQAAQVDNGLLGRISGDLNEFTGPVAQTQTAAGGYSGAGASTLFPGGALSAPGSTGATRASARRSGGSSGSSGASIPPRPQDIVEFLISRGGVRDDGGELRAMDTNRVQGGYGTGGVGQGAFGVLSRKNGRPPDNAREIAEEAGYLPRGSTISDLYDAVHDSTRGIPRYSDRDADIAANWEQFLKTGEPPPSPEPARLSPNFDQSAAQRYRAAAGATRDRAQTYNNPVVGQVLQENATGYRMLESRVPEQFLRNTESVQRFLSAGGDVATLRDALAADLRRSATNSDGTISPQKFASWQRRRDAALRAFPELDTTLRDAVKAQEAVDLAASSSRQQALDFQRGAARHFLNAEPDKAVQAAFASKNPVADFREISRLVKDDPDAKAGLQRAVADHVSRRFIGNTEAGTTGVGTLKSDAFQTFMKTNRAALGQIFTPQQIRSMDMVAADLQRSNRSIASTKIPGQSNTVQDLSILGNIALSAGGGGAMYFVGGGTAGVLAGLGAGAARILVSRMKAAGIEKTDQLVTEALLNPEIARTLLLKPNPANRPYIARRLRTSIGRLAAPAAVAGQGDAEKQ